MRIGLVCPYDLSKPGGVQAQVRGLASKLRETGDDVLVMAPGLPADVPGVDLGGSITVPGNRSRVPLSADPRVAKAIGSAATSLDLLHVHEPLMPTVSLSALRAGRPVVATFHAAPGRVGSALYKLLGSQLTRVLGANTRRITAVSATAAAVLPHDLEVSIVPNGVDTRAFDVQVTRHPHRVAFLGRDEPRKGLDVLLEAWRTVSQVVSTSELVVMGADRDVAGVTSMGPVDDETKAEVLASSAVVVTPNLGGESFGVVLVEAMAAGAAVVASDLESFRAVGGDSVRYFSTGDSGELAGVLVALLGDAAGVESLSRAGKDRAARFDWSTVAARYREIYEKALS
ncbi:MAG TPA: glycosyltransferase family 4 protein [Acidimicrobiia bacterium]|nr:glycosyltransferase family 4 protein [Acidimicrobiia bacterium]